MGKIKWGIGAVLGGEDGFGAKIRVEEGACGGSGGVEFVERGEERGEAGEGVGFGGSTGEGELEEGCALGRVGYGVAAVVAGVGEEDLLGWRNGGAEGFRGGDEAASLSEGVGYGVGEVLADEIGALGAGIGRVGEVAVAGAVAGGFVERPVRVGEAA